MDLKVNFDNIPFSIDFNKIVTGKYQKLQTVIYYLLTPPGYDLIYPQLGINPALYSADRMIIIKAINDLFYELQQIFNINASLKNVRINENNEVEISIVIEHEGAFNVNIPLDSLKVML